MSKPATDQIALDRVRIDGGTGAKSGSKSMKAYCKHCFQTHSEWFEQCAIEYGRPGIWKCDICDHTGAEEFLFSPRQLRRKKSFGIKGSAVPELQEARNEMAHARSLIAGFIALPGNHDLEGDQLISQLDSAIIELDGWL